MNGWDIDVLQSAVTGCTNPSGRTEDCPVFNNKLQSEPKMGQCEIEKLPAMLKSDDCAGPAKGLCGNVPVQYGPGYAAPLKPGSGEKPTAAPIISSVAPVPTQSYAPARSEGAGGISVFNVKEKPSPTPEYPVNAPPVVTAAPAKQEVDNAVNGKIISTTTYTSGGIVYEVAIEEVAVTVTVTDDAAKKHRRHANAHMRKRGGARA